MDEAIAATQAVIDQLQVLKKAMMAELLTRGIPGRHTKFKMTEIGAVPKDWEVVPLERVLEVQLGKMLSKSAKIGEQLPYLANRNVRWGRFDLESLGTMAFSEKEKVKYSLRRGDLLVCEGGEVGRCAVWTGEIDTCYFQKALHRLRPKTESLDPWFVSHFMAWAALTGMFSNLTSRSSIAHLTKEKLATLRVVLPSPEEQRKISSLLGTLDRRTDKELSCRGALQNCKVGIMAVLLTGEHRVQPEEDAA